MATGEGGRAATAAGISRRARLAAVLVAALGLAVFELGVLRAAASRGPQPSPEPPPELALAPRAAPPQVGATALRRHPFLPPLAPEAVAEPGHGPLFTPDLAEVAPLAVPPPPPAPATAPRPTEPALPVPELAVGPELPPAEAQPLRLDLPTPVPVRLELEGACPRLSLGPFRLGLRCAR